MSSATQYNGTIKVKTPTNTSRYGVGDIECDNSLILREQTPTTNPATNYDKIYVDATSKRLRMRDSVGIPRNVGTLYEQHVINVVITNTTVANPGQQIRTFIISGSENYGVPTKISVLFNTTVNSNQLYLRINNISPAGSLFGVTPTFAPLVTTAGPPNGIRINSFINPFNASYPVTDSGVNLLAARTNGGGGTVTLLSLVIYY